MVGLLKTRARELAVTLDADYPDLRSSIWLSQEAAQSSVQSLTPQMTENRKRVRLALVHCIPCFSAVTFMHWGGWISL